MQSPTHPCRGWLPLHRRADEAEGRKEEQEAPGPKLEAALCAPCEHPKELTPEEPQLGETCGLHCEGNRSAGNAQIGLV